MLDLGVYIWVCIYIYKCVYYSPKVLLSRGLNGDNRDSTALRAPFPYPGWRFQELRRLQRAWKAMVASNLSRLGDVWGAESDSQGVLKVECPVLPFLIFIGHKILQYIPR